LRNGTTHDFFLKVFSSFKKRKIILKKTFKIKSKRLRVLLLLCYPALSVRSQGQFNHFVLRMLTVLVLLMLLSHDGGGEEGIRLNQH